MQWCLDRIKFYASFQVRNHLNYVIKSRKSLGLIVYLTTSHFVDFVVMHISWAIRRYLVWFSFYCISTIVDY